MTGKERIAALIEGRPVDRPPFIPAVYEHKAALIGQTPSAIARDPLLLERAMLREAELYGADTLTAGVDVYNVEAEAAGCRVSFPATNDVPAIEERAIGPGEPVRRRPRPDPERDGRMPVFLEAGRRVQERIGDRVVIRGALSAPFSMACEMAGAEAVLTALVEYPDWIEDLLEFCAGITVTYGRAFLRRGLGVVLFDSHASPPLVSPRLYRSLILPPTAGVIAALRRDAGRGPIPYIVGGDTALILDLILETGTDNVLCDFKADLDVFLRRLRDRPVLLRANMDPRFLLTASPSRIEEAARLLIARGRLHPQFILGTGILPYDLAPEKVLAVRGALAGRDRSG